MATMMITTMIITVGVISIIDKIAVGLIGFEGSIVGTARVYTPTAGEG